MPLIAVSFTTRSRTTRPSKRTASRSRAPPKRRFFCGRNIDALSRNVNVGQASRLPPVGEYVVSTLPPSRLERGLQAASPAALSRGPGISQRSWDSPTRRRRKRRAPFACATATLNRSSAKPTDPPPPCLQSLQSLQIRQD